MPLAALERELLRLLAAHRNPDSCVGGATVLLRGDNTQRQTLYPPTRLASLDRTEPVNLTDLKKEWLAATREAFMLFQELPPDDVGCLYLDSENRVVNPDPKSPEFPELRPHFGSIRGAWPVIRT